MIAHRSNMWELYEFHNYKVMVIQQWHNPLGCPMVRIAITDASKDIAEGMPEEQFMVEAKPLVGEHLI